jgi:peptide/nickel transport system permease protein
VFGLVLIARRAWQLVPTLFLASVVIFLVMRLSPGDPVVIMLGQDATASQLQSERAALGLDRPLPVQYGIWLGSVLRLDLGRSYINRQPVWGLIRQRLPATLELALTAFVVSTVVGVALGVVAAVRPGSLADSLVTAFNVVAFSVPSFWVGLVLILVFSVDLGWLPPSGHGNPVGDPVGELRHLLLPLVTLSFGSSAVKARLVRTAMVEALSADYVRTAYAKGLPRRAVLNGHALRNALLPVVTAIAIQFGGILGGAVVTETVFNWPGMGRLLVDSISNRDYSVVQGILLLIVFTFVIVTLCVDVLYEFIDPRIRVQGKR